MPPLPPPPSNDVWCIGWHLCIRMCVDGATSYPTIIILLSYIFCQMTRTPFVKWYQSPKVGDATSSPRRDNCSVVSWLAPCQRARLNSQRWHCKTLASLYTSIWCTKISRHHPFWWSHTYIRTQRPNQPTQPLILPIINNVFVCGRIGGINNKAPTTVFA